MARAQCETPGKLVGRLVGVGRHARRRTPRALYAAAGRRAGTGPVRSQRNGGHHRMINNRDHLKGLGEFIRTQRELANLSLRQLADLAKVSNPYLSQVERGLYKPSAEVLKQIA